MKITVAHTLFEFDRLVAKRTDAARRHFDTLDAAAHAELDMDLTSLVDELFRERLGQWEKEGAPWFHNLDFYGDGVRGLQFLLGVFPRDTLPTLREYLGGAHRGFSALINLYSSKLGEDSDRVGALWLSSDEAIVTRATADLVPVVV